MSMSQWDRNELSSEINFLKKYISQFKKRIDECEAILLADKLKTGTDIETLALNIRIEKVLKQSGIVTVEELLEFVNHVSFNGLMKLRNVGEKGAREIVNSLIAFGHLPADYRASETEMANGK